MSKRRLTENHQKAHAAEEVVALFSPLYFIAAAYQFGSTVRDQGSPLSDLDIAILIREGAPFGRKLLQLELLLAHEIQRRLGNREVDLITLNHQRLTLH